MYLLTMIQMLFVLMMIFILVTTKLKHNTTTQNKEKLSSFECGFDPEHKMRNTISMRFFMLTMIFLIFDVEVAIILPLPLMLDMFFLMKLSLNIMVFFLLLGGLIFEWTQNSFNWF